MQSALSILRNEKEKQPDEARIVRFDGEAYRQTCDSDEQEAIAEEAPCCDDAQAHNNPGGIALKQYARAVGQHKSDEDACEKWSGFRRDLPDQKAGEDQASAVQYGPAPLCRNPRQHRER